MIGKDFPVNKFKHTELIGHYITLSINTVAVDVCCRSIVAAQIQAIILDRLHQCPQTNQVRVTIEILCSNLITSTNTGIQLLLDLRCLFIRNELTGSRHLTGKVADFFHISKGSLTVCNVGIRFDEQNIIGALQILHQRECPTVTQIVVCFIHCMGCNDNPLLYYLCELVSDSVGLVFRRSTKPDKIALQNGV